MKNEVRINVYVWADFSASTSRVDGKGMRGARRRATGGRATLPRRHRASPAPTRAPRLIARARSHSTY